MSEFNNVSVIKAANVYFEGKVTSRSVLFADGTKKTLGYMQAGDYEFGTEKAEIMEALGGKAEVLLPNNDNWQIFEAGSSFEVPANSSFKLKIDQGFDYCCSYID